MKKKVLLCVQGTCQYMAALVAVLYNQKIDGKERDLYACFYDLSIDDTVAIDIYSQMDEINKSFNLIKTYFFSNEMIHSLSLKLRNKSKNMVKEIIGVYDFDEIYLANLGNYSNRLFANAYINASHIQYGDSFGIIGNEDYKHKTNDMVYRLKEVVKNVLFDFNKKSASFSKHILILPVSLNGAKNKVKQLIIPEVDFVRSVIKRFDISDYNIAEYGTYCLLLTSNLAQSGYISELQEKQFYKNIIDTIPKDINIVVKLHPRVDKKSYLDILGNSNVILFESENDRLPVESMYSLITNASFIVPVFSSAKQNLKYFFNSEIKYDLCDNDIRMLFNKEYVKRALEAIKVSTEICEKLGNWAHDDFIVQY